MSGPTPYVPLDERGWRLAMGLRPLDLSRWLEVDRHRDEDLAQKAALLADRRDLVVATRPEGDDASRELLDEVLAWLATHRPDLASAADPLEHPIVAASRLIQEDLCVLVRSDEWRLQAASVCFPSRWDLASKIGTTLDQIHRPVPGYDEELARPTNSTFDRLKPERPFWRLNWTLIDNPDLHQPVRNPGAPHGGLPDWFFRVERQTIRRLPASGAVVFTIHNYVSALGEMVDADGSFAENLLRAIDEAPPAMKDYKGWQGVSDHLRSVLNPSP